MRTALILAVILFWIPLYEAFGAATGQPVDMGKIAHIESSGCKNLVGDNGKALGCYQLHKGVVAEYNQYKRALYRHDDVMRPDIGLKIANWYMNERIPNLLKYYGKKDTIKNRIFCYNMGIGNFIKKGEENAPRTTKEYYRKYQDLSKLQ